MPAAPGFYHRPTRIDDLVDFIVARVLDHLGVSHTIGQRLGRREAGGRGRAVTAARVVGLISDTHGLLRPDVHTALPAST
jgi:hypothetical protein